MSPDRLILALACAAFSLPPAPARAYDQETQPPASTASLDWDVIRDPARKMVAAYVQVDSGLSVVLRCTNGGYDALLAGLPEARGETRNLVLTHGGDSSTHQSWSVGSSPGIALSPLPAPFARKLRNGGQLSILVPDGGGAGRDLRHVVQLPASSSAIDETLTACGRPLADPRDNTLSDPGENGLSSGVAWDRMPLPAPPETTRYSQGFATLSCMAQPDGRLSSCIVESEYPSGSGFGENALRAMRRARLKSIDSANAEPRMVVFRIKFTQN